MVSNIVANGIYKWFTLFNLCCMIYIYIMWRGATSESRDGFRPLRDNRYLIVTAGVIPAATEDTERCRNERTYKWTYPKTIMVLSCVLADGRLSTFAMRLWLPGP